MATEQNKHCPKCGYEYQPWVDVCPDCGTLLETRPKLELIKGHKGQLNADSDPGWTIVTNVPNAILGNFVKGQLEDAGIPVLMFRSKSADIAEFSHNDFVPHDLLVPRNRFREARNLIDSAPGNSYGPRLWNINDEDDGVETENNTMASEDEAIDPNADPDNNSLPEGWTMLPTEADLRALQEVRRTHGENLKGWYWSDDRSPNAPRRPQPALEYEEEQPYYSPVEEAQYPELLRPRPGSPYGTQGYTSGWSQPSKWIKLFYAILLLVMSLPFIFQLLGQVWSLLDRLR